MRRKFPSKYLLLDLIILLVFAMLSTCNPIELQLTSVPVSTLVETPYLDGIKTSVVDMQSPIKISLLTAWEMLTVNGVAWHPIDNFIAIAGWKTTDVNGIQVYDLQTLHEMWFKEGYSNGISFVPERDFVIGTSFYEPMIQFLRVEDGQVVSTMVNYDCTTGEWPVVNGNGNTILTGHGSGHINWETTINLWDTETGKCQKLGEQAGFLNFLDIDKDFNFVALSVLTQENEVSIWDIHEKKEVCNFSGKFGLFVPLNTSLIAVSDVETLSFYDLKSCQQVRELKIDAPYLGYMSFSPNGKYVVTANKYLQVWDVSTGELLFQTKLLDNLTPSNSRPRLIFSPDGNYLLAVFSTKGNKMKGDDLIQVWQVVNSP